MEGGHLYWPIWVPYKLYGVVDHVYGWKAFDARNGFTGAQSFMNAVESAMYLVYLYLFYKSGAGAARNGRIASGGIEGRDGAMALLVAFSAAVMTFSKTVLYWMNEYYSGFSNIGHNSVVDLIFLWIIPKYVYFPSRISAESVGQRRIERC
jgi:hypothetical protein